MATVTRVRVCRLCATFLLWAAPTVSAQSGDSRDEPELYVSSPLKFRSEKVRGLRPPKLALGTILAFEPRGGLAIVSGYFFRDSDRRLYLLFQSGFVVSYGVWSRDRERIKAQVTRIHGAPRNGQWIEPYREQEWTFVPSVRSGRMAERLQHNGKRFVFLENFGDVKRLQGVVEFERRIYDELRLQLAMLGIRLLR